MLAIKGIYDGNNIIPIENITSDGNEIKNEFIRAVRIFDLTGRKAGMQSSYLFGRKYGDAN